MERCVEQEQALVRETFRCREELHMLGCLAQIKADEREHKSRELLRAGVTHTHTHTCNQHTHTCNQHTHAHMEPTCTHV